MMAQALGGAEAMHFELRAFLECNRGLEGMSLPWLPGASSTVLWTVLKSRDIGAPANRLCEAAFVENRSRRLSRARVIEVWRTLPGAQLWTPLDELHSPRDLSGKRLAASSHNQSCSIQSWRSVATCKPLLFVVQPYSTPANTTLAIDTSFRSRPQPGVRASEASELLKRLRGEEEMWHLLAMNYTRLRADTMEYERGSAHYTRACPDDGRAAAPQIFSMKGLHAALKSGLCSRACAAVRMRRRVLISKEGEVETKMPCLVANRHPQCRAHHETVLVVAAHWSGGLRFLQEQPFCYLVIEKNERSVHETLEYIVPNKANEASSYLHFITKHYDSMPDTTIFLQDQQTSKHNQDMVVLLRQLHLDAAPYIPLNNVHMPFMDPRDFCHVRRCIAESGIGKYLNQSSLPRHHLDIAFACCAQFAVSRDAVRSRPKELYEDLYRYTLGAVDFGQRSDSFARGECLEVMWHAIFGQRLVEPPMKAPQRCGKGQPPSRICSMTSGLHGFVSPNGTFWSWAAPVWLNTNASHRRQLRLSEGTLFEEAVQQGALCVTQRSAGRLPITMSAYGCPSGRRPPTWFRRQLQDSSVWVTIPALGGQAHELSTNCTLIDASSTPVGSRRKLVHTLRQHCTGGSPARISRGMGSKLFWKALCALFESDMQSLGQLDAQRRSRLAAKRRHGGLDPPRRWAATQ